MKIKRETALLIIFTIILGSFLLQPIHLITSDLGRHLTNGRLLFSNGSILFTNTYSYTYPDFPFINHHWFSGVIFFLTQQVGGFPGLSLFAMTLGITSFLLFFWIGKKNSSMRYALVASVVVLPLLIRRTELRPELFSYILLGLFLLIIIQCEKGKISRKWLVLLPLLEVLWVNLHIYFFLGAFVVVLFMIKQLLGKKQPIISRIQLFLLVFLTLFATLINPHILTGALYPFFVFQNYGYKLLENASASDIVRRGGFLSLLPYFSTLLLVWTSYGSLIVRKKPFNTYLLILSLLTTLLSLFSIRNIQLFGYVSLAALGVSLQHLAIKKIGFFKIALFSVVAINSATLSLTLFQLFTGERPIGIGLDRQSKETLAFLSTHRIKGRIFNDYDVGGFLIYALYPTQRVFVDNRPEAYPASFFTTTYIPMQLGAKWDRGMQEYNLQTIIFSKQDQSVWAKTFLFRRLHDRMWEKMFDNDSIIIFTKRS